jgi:hypothetical protein
VVVGHGWPSCLAAPSNDQNHFEAVFHHKSLFFRERDPSFVLMSPFTVYCLLGDDDRFTAHLPIAAATT